MYIFTLLYCNILLPIKTFNISILSSDQVDMRSKCRSTFINWWTSAKLSHSRRTTLIFRAVSQSEFRRPYLFILTNIFVLYLFPRTFRSPSRVSSFEIGTVHFLFFMMSFASFFRDVFGPVRSTNGRRNYTSNKYHIKQRRTTMAPWSLFFIDTYICMY